MVPCCRRHHPWRRKTFLDNSEFLRFRPAPTPTSLHNLKAAHLATISKDIHTDSQLQVGKTRKTAVLGRIRRTDKVSEGRSAIALRGRSSPGPPGQEIPFNRQLANLGDQSWCKASPSRAHAPRHPPKRSRRARKGSP